MATADDGVIFRITCPVMTDEVPADPIELSQGKQSELDGADPFALPPEASGPFFRTDGNRVILHTGSGDDKVSVRVDPATGEQLLEVNGITYRFPAGADITIRTGTIQPGWTTS